MYPFHTFLSLVIFVLSAKESKPQVLDRLGCSEGTHQRQINDSFQLSSKLSSSNFHQMNCAVNPSTYTSVLKLQLKTSGSVIVNSPFSQKEQIAEVHVLVVDNAGEIVFRKDIRNSSFSEESYLVCPGLKYNERPVFEVITIGNVEHEFFGELVDTNMSPGEAVATVLNTDEKFNLMAFEVGSNSKKQFQITARSEDDTPCRMTVSKGCYAAQGLEQESYSSIGLTFSKFGRLTLSSASKPALQSGHWFIAIQPLKKDLPPKWSKKITLMAEYGYDNEDRPVLYVALLSLFGGVFVAIYSHLFLNPLLETPTRDELDGHRHTTKSGKCEPEQKRTGIEEVHIEVDERSRNVNTLDGLRSDEELKHYHPKVTPTSSVTAGADETTTPTFYNNIENTPDEPEQIYFPKPVFLLKAFVLHWFKRGKKTFSYTTGIMAISLLVGTMQFLIASWSKMYNSGDRDICFYNDACYRPLENYDIPYNLIISNLAYCMHGVILALSIGVREAMAIQTGRECDYSIAYAFAWTLIFEGMFSSFYHLCPSRQTFQFDSAFMFVISGLVVVALFNSRAKCATSDSSTKPVNSSKFFLFFICPLLLLNYLGSMRDTTGLPAFGDFVFWLFLFVWLGFMYGWVLFKLQIADWHCQPVCKFKWVLVLGIVPVLLLGIGLATRNDWSQFFLFACIAGSGLAIFGDIMTKMLERFYEYRRHQRHKDQKTNVGHFLDKAYLNWRVFFRVLYCILLGICWGFAVYYFIFIPVTKKTSTPDYSRTFNKECVFFNYYDPHDLWHILSSFALLMSSFLLIYIT